MNYPTPIIPLTVIIWLDKSNDDSSDLKSHNVYRLFHRRF